MKKTNGLLRTLTALLLSFFLGAIGAVATSGPDTPPNPITVLAVTLCGVAVGIAFAKPDKRGILGLNTYSFGFGVDPTPNATFVAGDAANAAKLCRAFGYLWLSAQRAWSTRAWMSLVKQGDKLSGTLVNVHFQTKKVLPGSLEPGFNGQAYAASGQAGLIRASYDDQCNDIISNLENKLVTKGCLIVAVTLGGVDVSNELDTELRIPVGQDANGIQYLVLGFANTNAQDGVYDTPFSTALAYSALGSSETNTPVLIAGAQQVRRIGGISK